MFFVNALGDEKIFFNYQSRFSGFFFFHVSNCSSFDHKHYRSEMKHGVFDNSEPFLYSFGRDWADQLNFYPNSIVINFETTSCDSYILILILCSSLANNHLLGQKIHFPRRSLRLNEELFSEQKNLRTLWTRNFNIFVPIVGQNTDFSLAQEF